VWEKDMRGRGVWAEKKKKKHGEMPDKRGEEKL